MWCLWQQGPGLRDSEALELRSSQPSLSLPYHMSLLHPPSLLALSSDIMLSHVTTLIRLPVTISHSFPLYQDSNSWLLPPQSPHPPGHPLTPHLPPLTFLSCPATPSFLFTSPLNSPHSSYPTHSSVTSSPLLPTPSPLDALPFPQPFPQTPPCKVLLHPRHSSQNTILMGSDTFPLKTLNPPACHCIGLPLERKKKHYLDSPQANCRRVTWFLWLNISRGGTDSKISWWTCICH